MGLEAAPQRHLSVQPQDHSQQGQNHCNNNGSPSQTQLHTPRDPIPDIHLSDLKLGNRLGRGAFAEVFKSTYQGQEVAVKCFKNMEPDTVKLFERELELFRTLRHPNIVSLVATIQKPDWAIVMELVNGVDVYQYLHDPKYFGVKVTARTTVRMCFQIASAMAYLHRHNIVHRDLKPQNILVEKGTEDIKLIDFGLSRFEDGDSHMTGETGSYRWAAPEVLRSEKYSKSCDVYSFAIVAWEIITRRVPYGALDPVSAGLSVAARGLRPEVLKPSKTCPSALCDLVHECWSESPEKRPPFSEIQALLERLLKELPMEPEKGSGRHARSHKELRLNVDGTTEGALPRKSVSKSNKGLLRMKSAPPGVAGMGMAAPVVGKSSVTKRLAKAMSRLFRRTKSKAGEQHAGDHKIVITTEPTPS